MIIVEGPDGTGKTTIAKALCRIFQYHYVKSPGTIPFGNATAKTERMFWFKTMCKFEHVVMDRCYYISEPIYGPLFRERSSADEFETVGFLGEFTSHPGNLIVFCNEFYGHKEDHKNSEHIHLSEEEARDIEEQATERRDEVVKAYDDFIDNYSPYFAGYTLQIDNPVKGIEAIMENTRIMKRYERE